MCFFNIDFLALFLNFLRFFLIFRASRASQNRAKIINIRKKTIKIRCSGKTCFSTPYFHALSLFWLPKIAPKSIIFLYFFENVDFVKINKKPRKTYRFHGIFRFPASRNLLKIDAKTPSKKTSQKHLAKIDFGLHLVSQNLPKSLRNRPGTQQDGVSNETRF